MNSFNIVLHRTGERLGLPSATRSLILVEIASDLEELFQHYLQEGMSEEEAAERAEEKVDMSAIVAHGIVNPRAVWIGGAEGLVSSIAALLVLTVAGLCWYLLRWRFLTMRRTTKS